MTELAHGYLSLAVSTGGVVSDVQKALSSLQGDAEKAGRDVGAALTRGVAATGGDPFGPQKAALAKYEQQAKQTASAVEKAQEAQAAATRKVALEEQRLVELRESGNAKQSQILAAEDRLAKARSASAKSVLDVAAAEAKAKAAQDGRADALAKLTSAERAAAKAADENSEANKRSERSIRGVVDGLKESVRSFSAKLPNPFAKVPDDARQAGAQSADRMGDGFKANAGRLGDIIKGSVLGGLISNVASQAGAAVVEGFKDSVGKASDLNETISKSEQIFKKNAAAMLDWSSKAPRALGLSQAAALNAAASFGNMFQQLGFAGDKASSMSQQVVQLAADLGSFNNLGTEEVSDMLSAAFRGEYDSLQRLIPNINAARVETEALARTGKKSAKELTAQEKAAATLAIVQKDGAAAAGDFARTSDGMANKSKIVAAQMDQLKTAMGQRLLPVVEKVLTFISDKGVPFLERFGQGFQGLADLLLKGDFTSSFAQAFNLEEDSPAVDVLLRIREAVIGIFDIFAKGDYTGSLSKAFGIEEDSQLVGVLFDVRNGFIWAKEAAVGLYDALIRDDISDSFIFAFQGDADSPLAEFLWHVREGAIAVGDAFVTKVLPAIGSLVGWIRDELLPRLVGVATAVGEWLITVIPIVQQVAATILEKLGPLLPVVQEIFAAIGEFIAVALDNIRSKVEFVTAVIAYVWERWGEDIMAGIRNVMTVVIAIVHPALDLLRDIIRTATAVIKGDWSAAWEGVKSIVQDALRLIVVSVETSPLGIAFGKIMGAAKDAVSTGLKGIRDTWRKIVDVMGGPVKVVEDIVNGLIDAFNKVDSVFGSKHQVKHVDIGWSTAGADVALATGGVMPGYSPGRDVHHFFSPTGGGLHLSGGEAVMRPEFTRAVGSGWVDQMNLLARTRGASGVRQAFGGQAFAGGGIVSLRGHTFTAEFAKRILMAESIAGAMMQITQGGFRPATSYSGTSHQGDALDIAGDGYQRFILPLRMVGIPTWDRAGKGNWIAHAHGVPLPFAGSAAGSGAWQAMDYLVGGDGLGGRDDGPRPGILGDLSGIAINLGELGGSLIDWTKTFAPELSKVKEITSHDMGPWTQMLSEVPGALADAMTDGAKSLLGFARGTRSAPPGLAWVGEEGPELVNFAGGERVWTHAQSMAMTRGSAGVPSELVVVDQDGALIGRMRVEAGRAVADMWGEGTSVARKDVAAV